MGWTNSPPAFSAVSEAICDNANARMHRQFAPPHRLEQHAEPTEDPAADIAECMKQDPPADAPETSPQDATAAAVMRDQPIRRPSSPTSVAAAPEPAEPVPIVPNPVHPTA